MLREERYFLDELALDRVVGLIYAEFIEDMHFNRIPIPFEKSKEGGTKKEIRSSWLKNPQSIGNKNRDKDADVSILPFKGEYTLTLDKKKGEGDIYYLLSLKMVFYHLNRKSDLPHRYQFKIFVKNLSEKGNAEEKNNDNNKEG